MGRLSFGVDSIVVLQHHRQGEQRPQDDHADRVVLGFHRSQPPRDFFTTMALETARVRAV